VQASRGEISRILASGGAVRILLLDPTDDALIRAAEQHQPVTLHEGRLRPRIQQSLDELEFIRKTVGGNLSIRVSRFVPRMSVNSVESHDGTSVLIVQHYEHRPAGEHLPIFRLESKDGFWFQHFSAEVERLWASGLDWPLSTASRVERAPSPTFTEEFGPEFEVAISGARSLMITGLARNGFVKQRYSLLERLVNSGCTIRVLLVDPDCSAVGQLADRYYADRQALAVRPGIEQTLRLLHDLIQGGNTNLEVKLTDHPIGMGLVAIDPDHPESVVRSAFLEYYTFRAPLEPKFVLSPTTNPIWYEHFMREADELWQAAKPFVSEPFPPSTPQPGKPSDPTLSPSS
jgi:Domain of unknown function (DUF5919)